MISKNGLKKILSEREKVNKPLLHASLVKEVTTYMPVLIKVIQNSTGKVAELGTGLFSTPLIHWLCQDREVESYEAYKHYHDFAKLFKTTKHDIIYVKDWDTQEYGEHYGVVFIDHTIPRRKHTRGDDALKFKDKADYIVLHDAGENSNPKYGYDKVYKEFKYVKHFTYDEPNTTVVSNTKDLSNI